MYLVHFIKTIINAEATVPDFDKMPVKARVPRYKFLKYDRIDKSRRTT